MSQDIRESDWKIFRELRAIALERFCEQVLAEIANLVADGQKSHHDRYLAIFQLIKERDGELANAFDDLRRSTAVRKLAVIQLHDLLTPGEMARFSPEMQESVRGLVKIYRS
jgi:hypothetical protein